MNRFILLATVSALFPVASPAQDSPLPPPPAPVLPAAPAPTLPTTPATPVAPGTVRPAAPAVPVQQPVAAAPTAPAAPTTPAASPTTPLPDDFPGAGPWKRLFDGVKLDGMRGLTKQQFMGPRGWLIEDGELHLPKEVRDSGQTTGGDLVSSEAFMDFEIAFEFKLTVGGDSGVIYFVRGGGIGQPAVGCEYQIIDDTRNPDGLKGGPIKHTGALYGALPPMNKHFRQPEDIRDPMPWNEGRIVVRGARVEHWLNDGKVLEYDLGSPATTRAIATFGGKAPSGFGAKFKTHLVIADQGEDVSFRNIRVRALPPMPAGTAPAVLPSAATVTSGSSIGSVKPGTLGTSKPLGSSTGPGIKPAATPRPTPRPFFSR